MNIRNNTSTDKFGELLRKHPELFKPLTKKEEQELIKSNKHDPDKVRKLLVQHNIRLVFNLARKYAPTSMDFDELIGRGFEGLSYAAKKFDLNRNIKFITYATPWVFKYIVKEYFDKDLTASKLGVSLQKNIKDEDGGATFANIVDTYVSPDYSPSGESLSTEHQIEQNEKGQIYSDLLQYVQEDPSFDDLDRQIFQRNFLEKDSIREISADLNLQYCQVSKRRKDLQGRLKNYLEDTWGITSAFGEN